MPIVTSWRQAGGEQGVEQGVEQGIAPEERSLILRLLNAQVGQLSEVLRSLGSAIIRHQWGYCICAPTPLDVVLR